MQTRGLVAFLALISMAGCLPDQEGTPGVSSTVITTTNPPAPSSTQPVPCSGNEFIEGGHVAEIDGAGSDAQTIGLISWAVRGGCETFTVGFGSSEGAPATTPPTVIVDFLDPAPILRVTLGVSGSVVADQLVDSGLVERLFVVNGLDGRLYLDIHLKGAAQARVSTRQSPASVSVELQQGIVDPAGAPIVGERLVVISPLEGVANSSPVTISGYTRGVESGLLVIATSGDVVLGEHQLDPAQGAGVWSEFTTTLALDEGEVTIFIGEEGTDGLEGVTIPITVG
jgi:hypothetical protein